MRTSWSEIITWRDYEGAERYLQAVAAAGPPPAGITIDTLGFVARGVWAATTPNMVALSRALLDDDPWIARGLMTNPAAPPRLFRMVTCHPGAGVRTFTGYAWSVLSQRWNLTPDNYTWQASTAIETIMTAGPQKVGLFCDYHHPSVRRTVAKHPQAPQDALVNMAAGDHDPKVLEYIAERTDLTAPVWKALSLRAPERNLVITALLNPTTPLHALRVWSKSAHCEPDLREDINQMWEQVH